jgi:hypothetical protein
MVETAIFSMFHRAAPAPATETVRDAASEPTPDPVPSSVAIAPPLTKPRSPGQTRARRQAIREGVGQPNPQAYWDGVEQSPEQPLPVVQQAITVSALPPVVLASEPEPSGWARTSFPGAEYQLLGTASPEACIVVGSLESGAPVGLSAGRTGVYRPDGFWPASWAGFPYEAPSGDRTGLVAGTRILTSRGELAVEQLLVGDFALALREPALLPIVWIGRSTASALPVQIAAGAFGPGRPRRSLRVAADHPIFLDMRPVPARELVNGRTIQLLEIAAADLFHIDVGVAELLFAEGVPVGSSWRADPSRA